MKNKLVASSLTNVLIDSYLLYLKTQNYHWNVTGINFHSLHLLFETQYTDLAIAIDLLAERIRALGEKVPATFSQYSKASRLAEGNANLDAQKMVEELAQDQEIIIATIKETLEVAQKTSDDVTISILTDRLEIHQKNAWMLNSSK